ncbi:MAG: zinc-dependent metalloprotease [Acidimicrobiia bacterium]
MSENPQIPGEDGQPLPFGLPADFDLAALMRILASPGPLNWEVAHQVAGFVALGAEDTTPMMTFGTTNVPTDSPIDPAVDAECRAMADLARQHVASTTGITEVLATSVFVLGRRAWADTHLDALRPVLEAFATPLQRTLESNPFPEGESPFGQELMPGLGSLAGMLPMMAPLLLGMQAGSMVGELAKHALGRYDLPLPTNDQPTIVFSEPNITAFADAWSLDARSVRLHVALFETVRVALRTVPWVQRRLSRLAIEYVSGYEIDAERMRSAFGEFDERLLGGGMLDPAQLDEEAFAGFEVDPQTLLGAMRSPRQVVTLRELQTLFAILEGFADTVCAQIGSGLIPEFTRVEEARRRHRLERGEADRFIEGLLGVELTRAQYELGEHFCTGVVERAGLEGLNRIWSSEQMLPTPAEIEAPGLWLARIDLPESNNT